MLSHKVKGQPSGHKVSKRSSSGDLHLELALVADKSMYRHHGEGLRQYMLTVANVVSVSVCLSVCLSVCMSICLFSFLHILSIFSVNVMFLDILWHNVYIINRNVFLPR